MQPDVSPQPHRRFHPLAMLAPVLALLLTAAVAGCGPSDSEGDAGSNSPNEPGDDADRQAYADVFAASYTLVGEKIVTAEQAQCLGEHYVDTIGLDEIRSAGISPDDLETDGDVFDQLDLDEAEANALYEQFDACDIDPKEVIVGLAQLFKEEALSAEEQACLDDALTPEAIRASFVGSMLGQEDPDDPADPTHCVDLGLDLPEPSDVSPSTTP